MRRHELEHILRAAAAISGAAEWVVVGSQAVLGQFPTAPAELLSSMEADVFALRDPADSELVEGSIGEGSPFHQTFGYYAHGVGADTAVLPAGWRERLITVQNENTGSGIGFCLEVHDLAVSKLVAGREKDLDFVARLVRHHLAEPAILRQRLERTPMSQEQATLCEGRLTRLVSTI